MLGNRHCSISGEGRLIENEMEAKREVKRTITKMLWIKFSSIYVGGGQVMRGFIISCMLFFVSLLVAYLEKARIIRKLEWEA